MYHNLHHYMNEISDEMARNYKEIQEWSSTDPGTAGDQGEENWAKWLCEWLPLVKTDQGSTFISPPDKRSGLGWLSGTETKELIQSSIADSPLKRYQKLSKQIEPWLNSSMGKRGKMQERY